MIPFLAKPKMQKIQHDDQRLAYVGRENAGGDFRAEIKCAGEYVDEDHRRQQEQFWR
jgi:hypothetical protein